MPDIATVRGQKNDFPAMLAGFQKQIEHALPKHLSAERMGRIALTEFRKNKALQDCDPRSVFASVIVASQAGLEPGVMGQGYLIPYKGECQFVPGWRGLVDLVARTGRASVWTGAVFEGDEFDYALGDRPFITHRPGGEDRYEKMTHVYAVGRVKGAEWPVIEVWTKAKVESHLKRYNKVGTKHYAHTYPEMYARKVALLQVLKYMPASIELQLAMEVEGVAGAGHQNIDLHQAATGEWIPSTEADAPDAKPPKTEAAIE